MKHFGTQTIETARLILRQYKMTDAEDMFRNWVADQEVSKFWGWEPHDDIEETKTLLSAWMKEYGRVDYYHWVIIHKETFQAVGYIYLNEMNDESRSASVHFLVSRSYWNQGIMTEACKAVMDFSFSKIGVLSIHTHHHVDNPASGKVLQKSSFRFIDTQYREIADCPRISGNYCFYEITKDDWLQAK
jgi:ribosomal-protein-alanine N-acetyltransferase